MGVNPRGKLCTENPRGVTNEMFFKIKVHRLRVWHAKENKTLKISKKTLKRLKDPGDKKRKKNLWIHVEKGRGNPRTETNQMLSKLRWTMRQTRVKNGKNS